MPAVASSGDGMNQHSGGKYKQCCRQPSSSQEDERREAFQSNFFIFMAPLLQEKDDVHWNFCMEKRLHPVGKKLFDWPSGPKVLQFWLEITSALGPFEAIDAEERSKKGQALPLKDADGRSAVVGRCVMGIKIPQRGAIISALIS